MIRKKGKKFELVAKSTGKVLGRHGSREAALRQERAIKARQGKAAKKR